VVALKQPDTHHPGLHRFFQGATWFWAGLFLLLTLGMSFMMITEPYKLFMVLSSAVTIGLTLVGAAICVVWFLAVVRRLGLRLRFAQLSPLALFSPLVSGRLHAPSSLVARSLCFPARLRPPSRAVFPRRSVAALPRSSVQTARRPSARGGIPRACYFSGVRVGFRSLILASRPFTNAGDASVDRSWASRTASLIATPSGTSSAHSSS